MIVTRVRLARIVSECAHTAAKQKRKYTGEPYHTHPHAVAMIVSGLGNASKEMVAAAYLHDVIEDTDVTIDQIRDWFGNTVADYVWGLTNKSRPEDGNRATRVAIDQAALALQPAEVQTIKVADLMHNTVSIVAHDPKFAWQYLDEKSALLDVLTKADPELLLRASRQVAASLLQLSQKQP